MDKPEIMTLEEVAEYLRVSERTVYDWAQKGDIPSGKLGTAWRFKRSDIERWVDSRLNAGPVVKEVNPAQLMLSELLPQERLAVLDVKTKEEALNEMVALLAQSNLVKDKRQLKQGIFNREELMSTGIGMGVGVPHVRISGVRDLVMACAVIKSPLPDYESLDNEPVQLLFMIAAREDQHSQHLRVLAAISSALKDGTLKDQLIGAQSPAEMARIFRASE